jgi:hypothetical protein
MTAATITTTIAMMMVTEMGELTVTEAVLDVATALAASVTLTKTVYEAEEDGLKVQEEPTAPETAVPFKYHW